MADADRPKPVTIAWVQHARRGEERVDAHVQRVVGLIEGAAAQGATLVALPELFQHAYFPQREDPALFDLAEPVPGPITQRLGEVAQRLGIYLTCPLFERRAPGLYHNSAALIGPDGEIAALYRKCHIPHDPRFYEKYYFSPGPAQGDENNLQPTQLPGGIAVAQRICWDQWFPEHARLAALMGAQLVIYPTAIAWDADEPRAVQEQQLDAWRTMHKAHAIANGMYVLAVNRVGVEDALSFWGHSLLVDPSGAVVAECDATSEGVTTATIDPGMVEASRRAWPFFRDRRTDLYDGLTRSWIDPSGGDAP